MARNVKPFTTRLIIKDFWYTMGLPINNIPTHRIPQKTNENWVKFRLNAGSDELHQDKFIRDLISGCFLKLGILVSDIRLAKNCSGLVTIYFLYYPLVNMATENKALNTPQNLSKQQGQLSEYIPNLIFLVKKILSLKYPQQCFKFVCANAPHPLVDTNILNNLIKFSIAKDPKSFKPVLSKFIKIFKNLSRTPGL